MTDVSDVEKLAFNAALWGEVHPSLRAAVLTRNPSGFLLKFIFDGPISDDMRESCGCAEVEFHANFSVDIEVETAILRVDVPGDLRLEEGHVAFLRYERVEEKHAYLEQGNIVPFDDVRIAVNGALLGNVWPQLRYVSVMQQERQVRLCFVNHGEPEALAVELADRIARRVDAVTSGLFETKIELIRLDAPGRLPGGGGWTAYRRWEGW
jgi:hypothetical protein